MTEEDVVDCSTSTQGESAMKEWARNRKLTVCLFLCWLPSLFYADLHASQRHALVIGNSDYASSRLLNPHNDARDMTDQLRAMGYEIYGGGPVLDLDRIGIERTIRAFARSLPEQAHSLFYYAGHGISTREDNYLIPINHNLEYLEQLPDRAVSLRSVVELFKNANPDGINVLLLDACRDSPLSSDYRSSRKGLLKLHDIPRGIFIGYAADEGQVAEDGKGRNGTYTGELLQVMREKPDVIIEVAHKDVASRVFEKTGGEQFPVSENKVYGDWCFGICAEPLALGATSGFQAANVAVQPASAVSSSSFNWKVIGAVALGLLVVGAAMQDDNGPDAPSSFQLIVEPP